MEDTDDMVNVRLSRKLWLYVVAQARANRRSGTSELAMIVENDAARRNGTSLPKQEPQS